MFATHRFYGCVLICLLLAGCGPADPSETTVYNETSRPSAAAEPYPAPPLEDLESADLSILMYGNSHTGSSNLSGLLEGLYRAANPDKKIFTYVSQGIFLEDISASEWQHDLMRNHKWDTVILQGQKLSRSGKYYYPIEPAVELATTANESGARVFLYAEWARKGFDERERFENVYHDIAAQSESTVVPVGRAFERAIAERPELELYASDGNHASSAGSYLAACMLYGAVTGANPADIADDAENQTLINVSKEQRTFLREIASQTAQEYVAQQNLEKSNSLPLTYVNGVMFVEGTIGDSDPFTILVDTGANAPAIDDDLAERLSLPSSGRTTVVGTAGEIDVETVEISDLNVGARTLHDLKATVYDLSGSLAPEGKTVDAIVGLNFFKDVVVEVDFTKNRLQFLDASPTNARQFLPIELDNGIPRIQAALDGEYEIALRIDTGASLQQSDNIVTNVTERDFARLQEINPMIESIGQAVATGVGGEITLKMYRGKSIRVGDSSFESPTLIVQPSVGYFAGEDAVGFVSNNLLEKFGRIHIDYPAGRIWLHDNP